MIEACIDMLADHGGAMEVLGVYCGIRLSPRQGDLPREVLLLRKTAGESRMGRSDEVVGGLAGLSWKELGGD